MLVHISIQGESYIVESNPFRLYTLHQNPTRFDVIANSLEEALDFASDQYALSILLEFIAGDQSLVPHYIIDPETNTIRAPFQHSQVQLIGDAGVFAVLGSLTQEGNVSEYTVDGNEIYYEPPTTAAYDENGVPHLYVNGFRLWEFLMNSPGYLEVHPEEVAPVVALFIPEHRIIAEAELRKLVSREPEMNLLAPVLPILGQVIQPNSRVEDLYAAINTEFPEEELERLLW